jgi:hypothetical protein
MISGTDITSVSSGKKYFALEEFKKRRKCNFDMESATDIATDIASNVEEYNLNICILAIGFLGRE